MTIGFGNGNFYRLYQDDLDRFSDYYIDLFKAGGLAKVIELHCPTLRHFDHLINSQNAGLMHFEYISLHAPVYAYQKDEKSHVLLSKLNIVCEKYKIKNLVFHVDQVKDWAVFADYQTLPVSIENMDDRKSFGRSLEDIRSILDKYAFNLTLDLQHCFVNDPTLHLAEQFQDLYRDRIVEYHISGYEKNFLHYPLFKTRQDEIIDSLKYADKPIIIESTFDKIGEHESELKYIKHRLARH